jgi:hypothetical protein
MNATCFVVMVWDNSPLALGEADVEHRDTAATNPQALVDEEQDSPSPPAPMFPHCAPWEHTITSRRESAMKQKHLRPVAGVLAALLLLPLTGCQPTVNSQSAPGPAPMRQSGQPRQGMSTRNKVLLLAGAAALYYLYNKHKNRQGQGAQGRYYLSKNGRVYYRDLKTGAYRWVDPPRQPIQVPADEYQRYTGRQVEGYDGRVLRQAPQGWPPRAGSGYGGS